ncbi:MAG TPA: PDDEXK nuclease domain-containing protein [Flavisolibacter sp.]|nr:PDDEXK nuclease domain-containing protein [Flavisolibacter sp.]
MSQKDFVQIAELIKLARTSALKAVNTELINLYWNVGAFVSKQVQNSAWGQKKVDELAEFIKTNHPELKGFNRRGLYRMKQFYETYSSASFVSPVMTQIQLSENESTAIVSSAMTQFEISDVKESILTNISWTHHLTLLSRTSTDEEREFYLRLCIKEKYSVKELNRQISAALFERTMISNSQFPHSLKEKHSGIFNSFRDSYVFEFLNLPESHSESDLQKELIGQMKKFILELGKDFLFVEQEYKVQVGTRDFYIDLLFYHRGLQCLVAFELKKEKFEPEHLGKLNFYLEALDRDVKKETENPSIGILLCKDKDTEVVEYALSRSLSPTMVAEYKTQLPDKRLLQQKLHELFENSTDVA